MSGVLVVAASCVGGVLLGQFDLAAGLVVILVGGAAGCVIAWIELS